MKVVLCAYHRIGVEVLDYLVTSVRPDALMVYTHEAPPHVPSVADRCAALGIPVSFDNVNSATLPFQPDFLATVYYRYIIKNHVLGISGLQAFNVHPSLLPRHRGCSSVPWAIFEGDQYTGVSFHRLDPGIDTGRLLLQAVRKLRDDETQTSLYEALMSLGADFWPAAFALVHAGFPGTIQDEFGASYHRRGPPHGGAIDESWSEQQVERFIRAMAYPPYPYATYMGREVRSLTEYRELLAELRATNAPWRPR